MLVKVLCGTGGERCISVFTIFGCVCHKKSSRDSVELKNTGAHHSSRTITKNWKTLNMWDEDEDGRKLHLILYPKSFTLTRWSLARKEFTTFAVKSRRKPKKPQMLVTGIVRAAVHQMLEISTPRLSHTLLTLRFGFFGWSAQYGTQCAIRKLQSFSTQFLALRCFLIFTWKMNSQKNVSFFFGFFFCARKSKILMVHTLISCEIRLSRLNVAPEFHRQH